MSERSKAFMWAELRPINQFRPSLDSGSIILVTLSRPSPNRPKVYEFYFFLVH